MDNLKALPREQKLYIAAGGLVLFLVALLFLDWFGPFKASDIDSWWVALVLAAVAEALHFSLPVTGLTTGRALAATFLVFFWTGTHFLDGGSYEIGAWLGLIGSVISLVGAWLVDQDDRR